MVINVWPEHSASNVTIFTGQWEMESVYSWTLSPNDNLCTKPVQ